MPGPRPSYCPVFAEDFVRQAEFHVRRKTAPHQLVQRCQLVLLFHRWPQMGEEQAAQRVGLSGRQVRRWRKRWTQGEFSWDDAPGRGRKARFSPPGPSDGESRGL